MAPETKRKRSLRVSWSQLPIDLLDNIIRRLHLPIDAVSFGAVCKPWRYVALGMHTSLFCKLPIYHVLPKMSPLPLLLHPGCAGPDKYQLYSINEQKAHGSFHLPELSNKWIVGSGAGWLVTVDTAGPEINLLNPLTGKQIPLPPLSTLPSCDLNPDNNNRACCSYLTKAIVCSYQGTFFVVAIVSPREVIRFCKIGDLEWTRLENSPIDVDDIIMHNSKLYAVNRFTALIEIDIADPAKMTMIAVLPADRLPFTCKYYLVSVGGELVLLVRFCKQKKDSQVTSRFKVFKLVEDGCSGNSGMYETDTRMLYPGKAGHSLVRLRNLRHHMVFIGYNHSLSVDSRVYPTCKGNCIYFADNRFAHFDIFRMMGMNIEICHDVGVYRMAEKKVKYFKQFCKASSSMNMVWLSPNSSSEL